MLSGLMQPGMAAQLMGQASAQQAQQAGMQAPGLGGGGTPTGQQMMQQQGLGLAQSGQAGGQQTGMLAGQQAQQGQQLGMAGAGARGCVGVSREGAANATRCSCCLGALGCSLVRRLVKCGYPTH